MQSAAKVMDKAEPADHGVTTEGGISRPQLIAVLYVVGVLNGFAATILQSIHAEGLWQALGGTFGISSDCRAKLTPTAGTLLSWDAWLAAGLLDLLTGGGVERIENVIITNHGSLVVSASCSSLRNVLYGLLCWLTVARALRPEWQRGNLLAALIVSGAVVAANMLRTSLVGLSDESYERFHGMLAENVFNLGLVLFTAAVALGTSRHQATPVAR